MSDYIISCCSTADLSKEYLQERDIKYVCFHYQLGDDDYMDDMYTSMSEEEFYTSMLAGKMTRTSQVNVTEFENYFRPFLEEGKDIIHLSLSSGISGTCNSAMIAKSSLEEEYPDRKIYVIDSLAASSGYGLLMSKLADMRDKGATIEVLNDFALANRLKLHHWFFSSDLTFFIRGGRVTKTAGFVGNLLNICPLLNVDYVGKLIPRFKVRTKKKVIVAIVEQMLMHAESGEEYDGDCFISHSYCMEDAVAVKNLVEEKFPKLKDRVKIFPIGTTIGSHTGPGTVALFFWGDERVD